MNKKFSIKEVIIGTLTALFIPAFVIICSYRYELGYCEYYQLPIDFIKPDFVSNIKAFSNLFMFFIFFYLFPHIIILGTFDNLLKTKPYFHPFISSNLWIIIYSLSYLYMSNINNFIIIFFTFTVIFSNLIAYIKSIYIKEQLKQNRNIYEILNEYKLEVKINNYTDIFNLKSLIGFISPKSLRMVILLILMAYFSYHFGKKEAEKQSEFYVSASNSNYIVLRKYDQNILLKYYNPVNNQLEDSVIVINMNMKIDEVFYKKNIGKLVIDK